MPYRWRRFRRYAERLTRSVPNQSDDFVAHLVEKINHACAAELTPGGVVLYDESLTNRAIHIQLRVGAGEQVMRRYLAKMPAPALVVHLDASISTVLQRLESRKRTAGMHRNRTVIEVEEMERRALYLARMATMLLSDRGIHVITLDAKIDAEQTVKQVMEAITLGSPALTTEHS